MFSAIDFIQLQSNGQKVGVVAGGRITPMSASRGVGRPASFRRAGGCERPSDGLRGCGAGRSPSWGCVCGLCPGAVLFWRKKKKEEARERFLRLHSAPELPGAAG